MKTFQILPFVAFGLLAAPGAGHSQIEDNEASKSVLAVQCAMSSGFSATDYEDYCRRLAKTLSLLSNDQQTRVFGYLPMPGAATLKGAASGNDGIGSKSGANGGPDTNSQFANPVGDDSGGKEVAASQSSPLLSAVAKFNSLFDGTASLSSNAGATSTQASVTFQESGAVTPVTLASTTSAPVVGNVTATSLPNDATSTSPTGPSDSPTGQTTSTASGTTTKPRANWAALMAWFEAAEAAYKAGTLSSFLKGGDN